MLQRRLTDHLRKHEWTAIAIDFVIVVVGVFIGIQAANWNQARADAFRGHGYLERIHNDLEADLANYDDRISFWKAVSRYGRMGLDYAETGRINDATQWEVLLAYFQSSQVAEFWTRSTTYDEMKSTGELNLIANLELRNALATYYTDDAQNPVLTERPAYREHVRGVIPIDVQQYIWTKCYASNERSQEMRNCASPISVQRAADIVNEIRSDHALVSELRYWMSNMLVASSIARDRSALARRSLALVDTELTHEHH